MLQEEILQNQQTAAELYNYSKIAQDIAQTPKHEQDNPYAAVVGQFHDDQRNIINASIADAIKKNPDLSGEAQRLSAETGVPADIAERNIDDIRKMALQQRIEQKNLARSDPILARQLADPKFASIAYDQIDNLSTTEKIFKGVKEIPSDIKKGFKAGMLTTEYGLLGEASFMGRTTPEQEARIALINKEMSELKGSGGFLESASKILGQQATMMPYSISTGLGASMSAGGAALIAGQVGPQIAFPEEVVTVPAAMLGGFYAGSFGKMSEMSYRIEAGSQYLQMIEAGIDKDVAKRVGIGVGIVNAALEMTGVAAVAAPVKTALTSMVTQGISESLQKATTKKALATFAKDYSLAVAGEVGTEVLQEVVSIAGDELGRAINPQQMESLLSTEEGRKEITERLVGTFEEVAKGMALLGLAGPSIRFRSDFKRAQQSQKQEEFFANLNQLSSESEVKKRNPFAYEGYIEAQARGADVENVYIEGQKLNEVLAQTGVTREQIANVMPDVAQQINEAIQTGGDVVIPISKYATYVAGTEVGNNLMQHVRTSPEAMSAFEGQKFASEVESIAKVAEQQTQKNLIDAKEINQASQKVYEDIFDQLKSTGKYSDTVSRAYAGLVRDFVTTQSEALGIKPSEFFRPTIVAGKQEQVQTAPTEKIQEASMPELQGENGLQSAVSQVLQDQEISQGIQEIQQGADGGLAKIGSLMQTVINKVGSFFSEKKETPVQTEKPTQKIKGQFDPNTLKITLNEDADYSTFLHETGHMFLEIYSQMAELPNAPQRIKDDMNTVLNWFGIQDLQTWNAMSVDQQRQYHEQFALNFEIYLFEGKAPSVQMQSIFNRFSTWLRSIYKSIRDELNDVFKESTGKDLPIMTGEVRQVMDRMLASEKIIKYAEGIRNMTPMFQTMEESGMTPSEWDAYVQANTEATEEAIMNLSRNSIQQMRWLDRAKSKMIMDMQKLVESTRKQVRDEVIQQIKSDPTYQVIEFLKNGKIQGTDVEYPAKLSILEIQEMYGEGEMLDSINKKLGYGKYGMLGRENAIHPEQVAEMFGFQNAYTLIQNLLNARSFKDEVAYRTDKRMMEEHSELSNPDNVQKIIEDSIHNEARARFIAVELNAISKMMPKPRIMAAAAKQAAYDIINNKAIEDIRPRDHVLAEARASKEAEKSMKKANTIETVNAKKNQLLQNKLAAEALSARNEVQEAINDFRKFFKSDDKLSKSRNIDLINAARSILASYGLGKSDKLPTEYISQLKAYNPELFAEIEPIIYDAASGAKDFSQLTMGDFRALRETLESLWFQSRRDKQVMIEGKAMELETVVEELNSRLLEIGIPSEVAGERKAPGTKDRIVRQLQVGRAIIRRVEHWADSMDGITGIGPFTKYIWRTLRHALDDYRTVRNDFVKRYADLLAQVELKQFKINAPELNYEFGNGNGGFGKAELLGAIMHTGNISNMKKLLVGRGWGTILNDKTLDTSSWDTFMQRMIAEGIVTKKDMDFVQAVWDLNEEMKPIAQKAHKDLYGYYFKEVPNTPFTLEFGEYRGGYVPAKTDPFMVQDAQKNAKMEELESDFRYSIPSTGLGFTKSRVEYNRPLSLDIRVMTKHIDDVIRFAHVQPAIKDILKIVRNRDFSNNLSRIDPAAIEEMLLPWLNRSARQITVEPGMNKSVDNFWRVVRNRTGMAIMFANFVNAFQQLTGYFPASLKVKGTYLKTSLANYMAHPHSIANEVAELSPFMNDRMKNKMIDLQDNINDLILHPNRYQKIQSWSQKHAYFLQSAFQNQVDTVVWMAKYNQVLAESDKTMPDADVKNEAIAQADAAVRLTQDSILTEDLARFQVGTPFYKVFTQFAGYFNMIANLNATEYVKIIRDLGFRGNKGKLVYVYVMGFMLPMLVSEAIVKTFRGQWDDEDDDGYIDDVAEWFFVSQIRGAIGAIPVFGPGVLAVGNAFNNKPYDDRMSTSPSVSALESSTIGVVQAGINIMDPQKEVTGKNVRDVLTLISLATGIPLTVLGRTISYEVDVSRGKIHPTSEADYIRGLATGSASSESKK